jgi:glycosyltransferase involved in cell wall biosynthesis
MASCNVNIPYYGKLALLRETLRSIEKQKECQDYGVTVTVFDDCSPEMATEGVLNVPGSTLAVMRNPANLGMVANWNRCLEYGSGEWVHVLHCDDVLHPFFYAQVLPLFKSYEHVGFVHTDCDPIFARKSSTRYWGSIVRKHQARGNSVAVFNRGDDAVRHVMQGLYCSSVVLRREAVQDVGAFRSDLPYSSDEEYWARVAARWGVAYISKPLTRYRYHQDNYQLSTWTMPDFWDKWRQTRLAQMNHLRGRTDQDDRGQAQAMAVVAVGVAHKLLAKGSHVWASRFLEHASDAYPAIRDDAWFRRVSSWLEQGSIGRLKAWSRSSH